MSDTSRTCPQCGCAISTHRRFICQPCWNGLPASLRSTYNQSRTLADQRAAMRAILEHVRTEKQQPQLRL